MNKTKLHFWQLSFIFSIIVVFVLFGMWTNYQAETSDMMSQMMGQSMGDMMRMMHASNITLSNLLVWNQEMVQSNMNMHDQGGYLRWVYDFTTTVIFFLIPFILSITLLLIIVWHLS